MLCISLFFLLSGYFLTYPYELTYKGDKKVILLEDSYQENSLEDLISRKEFQGKVLYIRIWEPFDNEYIKKNDTLQRTTIEEQLLAIKHISNKFKSGELEIIFIADPDNKLKSKKDDMRKWKAAVKKYNTPGYHMLMNPDLAYITRVYIHEYSNGGALPHYFLADKKGNIVENMAPEPQDTNILFPQIINLLAN